MTWIEVPTGSTNLEQLTEDLAKFAEDHMDGNQREWFCEMLSRNNITIVISRPARETGICRTCGTYGCGYLCEE